MTLFRVCPTSKQSIKKYSFIISFCSFFLHCDFSYIYDKFFLSIWSQLEHPIQTLTNDEYGMIVGKLKIMQTEYKNNQENILY